MLDLTTIILTYNEEVHIRKCLENVCPVSRKVYVVDSPSTDRTAEIAGKFENVEVVVHKYPGNQAEQFNWALDNLPIDTEWVLRLDADEYLTPELINELEETLPTLDADVSALVLPLGRAFMGRVLKHGIVNGVSMIRIFRYGKARYEKRIMDEHLTVTDGRILTLKHKFVDDNRMPLSVFVAKHNNYSAREAALLIAGEYGLMNEGSNDENLADCVKNKRSEKDWYSRLPLFWRAFAYFGYRYFIKLGFLDGTEGFLWDFLQGWWYRTLVDAKVYEIKKKSGGDKERIKEILRGEYGIKI